VLSTESSSSRLIAAASTIASSYVESFPVHKAVELKEEMYQHIVMKEETSVKSKLDLSSRGRESLVFLAQLEHSLHQNSATITEILASLTTEYVYHEEFTQVIKSKTSSFHSVTETTARLYQTLLSNNRQAVAARVFNEYITHFLAVESKRIKMTEQSQVTVFLQTLLQYFNTHKSHNFIRSVGISSNNRVSELLQAGDYNNAVISLSPPFRTFRAPGGLPQAGNCKTHLDHGYGDYATESNTDTQPGAAQEDAFHFGHHPKGCAVRPERAQDQSGLNQPG
jgi:hypothetical protein